MEDGDVELITEWPVTTSCHEDDEDSLSNSGHTDEGGLLAPSSLTTSDVISRKRPHGGRQDSAISTKRKELPQKDDTDSDDLYRNAENDYACSNVVDSPITTHSSSHSMTTAENNLCRSSTCDIGQQDTTTSITGSNSNSALSREVLAQPRIARWWRRKGQQLVQFEQRKNDLGLPTTTNPNTLLFHVARLPEGRAFLAGERRQLQRKVDSGEGAADVLAALGSVEEWLGNADRALHWLKQAVDLEPFNKEWKWLLHKVERLQRVKDRQRELLSTVEPVPALPQAKQVERVSCRDLSFSDFFHRYAEPGRPVIITDIVSTMTKVPWDLQHIRNVAGHCEARVKQTVAGSVEWAGLEESRSVPVWQFLDNLEKGCQDYLFDWSLPLHCPRLAAELTIPRYFAGDFLQRSLPGSLYQDSWPSLFIAPAGVHSGLHVDAFASNFWMALFQGRKRWIFFREEDVPCLYPVYAHSLDPTFEVNVTDPDLDTHPLFSLAHSSECILQAGELLFVPKGSPHYVENLDASLAISANFVDLSNFSQVLSELDVNGLLDPRAAHLACQFQQSNFVTAMKPDMTDQPWSGFKTWPPADVDRYTLQRRGV